MKYRILTCPFLGSGSEESESIDLIFVFFVLANLGKEREVIDMTKNSKQTSKKIASKASKVLRDGHYSKTSKSVAGSALAQTKKSGR